MMNPIEVKDSYGEGMSVLLSNDAFVIGEVVLAIQDERHGNRTITLDKEGVIKLYSWLDLWICENVEMEF